MHEKNVHAPSSQQQARGREVRLTSVVITNAPYEPREQAGVPVVVCTDNGVGYLQTVQNAYQGTDADVIGFFHNDITIHDVGWDERVLCEFEDASVGVVGFGGASGVGHPDIYKIPYDYTQLARYDFISNLTDAEVHGTRFPGKRDVAFLDSMALIVRRELLDRVGGWPLHYPPHHGSDLWLCLTARKLGYRVRMVGVSCTHTSGGKGNAYVEWIKTTKWGSDEACHREAHKLLYNEFRGVLPCRVSR